MENFVTQVQLNSGMRQLHEQQPTNLEAAIKELVEDESGRVIELYPILGSHSTDLIVVCSFPNTRAASKAWISLGTRYGWRTQTNPSPDKTQFLSDFQAIQNVQSTAVSGRSVPTGGRS